LQAQGDPAGVADDSGGHMQQPISQRLGLGHGQVALQQQRLGPAGELLGAQDQLEPDAVAPPAVERQVLEAGGLGGADAVLDPGALTMPQLQPGQVRVGLVGEEDLEAVAVVVGEAQLGAGVGVFPSADRSGAVRPGVPVDPAGQLDHLGAGADLAVGVDRRCPGRLGLDQDGLADMSVDLHAKREADATPAEVPGQLGAGPGTGRTDQDRLVGCGRWQLLQRQVDQGDQVIAATGWGVARPE
jgi:hypothetical protein